MKKLHSESPFRADFFELIQNITAIQSKNKLKGDNIAQSVKWGHGHAESARNAMNQSEQTSLNLMEITKQTTLIK